MRVVVQVEVNANNLIIKEKGGDTYVIPGGLTERIAKKMAGFEQAYFYANKTPSGFSLKRYAPASEWAT